MYGEPLYYGPPTDDPYWKLRPMGPTDAEDLCNCPTIDALVLHDSFGPNPLYCLHCNGEVPPERVGFDAALAEDLAFWHKLQHALNALWLDSGEYEAWAVEQLSDLSGAVNTRAFTLAERISKFIRTYVWLFTDCTVDGYELPTQCPKCAGPLAPTRREEVFRCDACAIVVG
jgi:predicted  nucleic acid-binding Zn ribbon protein